MLRLDHRDERELVVPKINSNDSAHRRHRLERLSRTAQDGLQAENWPRSITFPHPFRVCQATGRDLLFRPNLLDWLRGRAKADRRPLTKTPAAMPREL